MSKYVLLTFDLEEFDLPLEFKHPLEVKEQLQITNEGLDRLSGLLAKYKIESTFFTTAFYAENNTEITKHLSGKHEIASHMYFHSDYKDEDILRSKLQLEKIIQQKVYGFRMPRFQQVNYSILKDSGYEYDSSINPTCIPGRYNNLNKKRTVHNEPSAGITVIPMSVTPIARIPLFWLSFKNMPYTFYLHLCRQTLRHDSYLNLCFHPWEFANLEKFNIPQYIKRLSGEKLMSRLEKLIIDLQQEAEFISMVHFLKSKP